MRGNEGKEKNNYRTGKDGKSAPRPVSTMGAPKADYHTTKINNELQHSWGLNGEKILTHFQSTAKAKVAMA